MQTSTTIMFFLALGATAACSQVEMSDTGWNAAGKDDGSSPPADGDSSGSSAEPGDEGDGESSGSANEEEEADNCSGKAKADCSGECTHSHYEGDGAGKPPKWVTDHGTCGWREAYYDPSWNFTFPAACECQKSAAEGGGACDGSSPPATE